MIICLNYVVDLCYGVFVDIGSVVYVGEFVFVVIVNVNVIW